MPDYSILIVEDEPIIARDIELSLKRLGYRPVAVVRSGEEAIVKTGELKPDVVLMDIMLDGEMSGLEAAQKINTEYGTPVIYLTASVSDDIHKTLNDNIFGYILKPFELIEIKTAIETAVRHRKTQDEWLKKEIMLFTALSNVSDCVIAHHHGTIIYANPAAEAFFKNTGLEGKHLDEICEIADPESEENYEYCTVFKNKGLVLKTATDEFYIETTSAEYDFESVRNHIITFRTIDPHKLTVNALIKNEERYRMFIDQISEGIWRFDIEPPMPVEIPVEEQISFLYKSIVVGDCNDVLARMYGFNNAEDLIGTKLLDLFIPSEPENIAFLKDFILAGYKIENGETHELDKEGNDKYFLNNSFGIVRKGHLHHIWGTQQDITALKKTEEALRQSEERYKAVVDNLNEGIIITDEHDKITFVNHRMEELADYSLQELLHQPVDNLILKREDLEIILKRRMQDRLGGIRDKYTEQLLRKDGAIIWVEISAAPYLDSSGKIIGSIGVFSDITQRVAAEEAMRQSEEKYRKLINNAPVGITRLLLHNNSFEVVNETFLLQTGLTLQDFDNSLKSKRASMIHPEDLPRVGQFSLDWFNSNYEGFRH
ncbi:MAG TPA: PAS domain S-box protein, partial [Patescibacteria group bacterium]|nr:PAS domain S-box protein [Patescibacteria group bacterium]